MMERTITVDTFTEVAAGVPVLEHGFTRKCGWLYEDGRMVGQIREVIEQSPVIPAQDFPPPTATPPVQRGPFTFVLW